jgi:glutamate-1-semialdehyde 2,1-aminomutase
MAAGIATLEMIRSDPSVYDRLQEHGRALVRGLVGAADAVEIEMYGVSVGALAGIFFSSHDVMNYAQAQASDGDRYARFWRGMLARGIYLPPSRFEALFLGAAHTRDDLERTLEAASEALSEVARAG